MKASFENVLAGTGPTGRFQQYADFEIPIIGFKIFVRPIQPIGLSWGIGDLTDRHASRSLKLQTNWNQIVFAGWIGLQMVTFEYSD